MAASGPRSWSRVLGTGLNSSARRGAGGAVGPGVPSLPVCVAAPSALAGPPALPARLPSSAICGNFSGRAGRLPFTDCPFGFKIAIRSGRTGRRTQGVRALGNWAPPCPRPRSPAAPGHARPARRGRSRVLPPSPSPAARHRREASGLGRAAARTRTRCPEALVRALFPALLAGSRPVRRRPSRHAVPVRRAPPAAAAAAGGARLGAAVPGRPLGASRLGPRRRLSGALRAGALRPAADRLRGRPRPRRVRLLRGVRRPGGSRVRPAGGPVRRGVAVRGALRGASLGHRAAARASRRLRVHQQRAGVRQRRQHLRQRVPAARRQPPLREAAPAAGYRPAARRLWPRYSVRARSRIGLSILPCPASAGPAAALRGGCTLKRCRVFRAPAQNRALGPARSWWRGSRVLHALCPTVPSQGDEASSPVAGPLGVARGATQSAGRTGTQIQREESASLGMVPCAQPRWDHNDSFMLVFFLLLCLPF